MSQGSVGYIDSPQKLAKAWRFIDRVDPAEIGTKLCHILFRQQTYRHNPMFCGHVCIPRIN